MPSDRPLLRLRDILEDIGRIETYVAGMDRAAFLADDKTGDAVERCLERISEAATKLGATAELLAPGPPWHAIRALGNHLRHAYDQVDRDRLWDVVESDLATLRAACEHAVTDRGEP